MWQYVFSVKEEISGYGKVSVQSDGTFLISDVAIFTQVVSGADTTIEAASVAKFLHELKQKGENPAQWSLWWHSHNNMKVFWSGTDEEAMSPGNNIGRPWLLSVVVNFKREMLGRLDIYTPVHATIDDIEILRNAAVEVPESIAEEVRAKVTRREATKYPAGFSTVNQKNNSYWEGYPEADDVPNVPRVPNTGFQRTLEFDELGIDDYLSDKDYELCRKVYNTPSKCSADEISRARKILQEWNVYL